MSDTKFGKELVDSLLEIKNDKFEVWKYFENRADQLGQQLSSTGTWLIGLAGALVTLPFVTKFIVVPNAIFPIWIQSRFALGLIAFSGILFCLFAYFSLTDLRSHILGNWRRAAYARNGKYEASWGGRKRAGWNVLMFVGQLAFAAFIIMLVLEPVLN